jgi:hypothetical protein
MHIIITPTIACKTLTKGRTGTIHLSATIVLNSCKASIRQMIGIWDGTKFFFGYDLNLNGGQRWEHF